MQSRDQWLKELVGYLWGNHSLPLPLDQLVSQMKSKDDPKSSKTFRSGEIGSWKKEFDDEIKQAFKQYAGQILIKYGYERNNKW